MTLSFSTKWPDRMGELAGQPNHFEQKIWNCLLGIDYDRFSDYLHPDGLPSRSFGILPTYKEKIHPAKLHTIREDPHNRWTPGMDIHMVINNRTKDRFQFAPVLKCVSVQKIEIEWMNGVAWVSIDNRTFTTFRKANGRCEYGENAKDLARNDGFPSVEAFFKYFNSDFKGELIHWTNFKY